MTRIGVAALGLLLAFHAQAAEITVATSPYDRDLAEFAVRGELSSGDGERFRALAARYRRGVVTFDSMGGSLIEGLTIGEAVRSRGFDTRIDEDAACISACALAWLGGRTRALSRTAHVGFQAVNDPDGTAPDMGHALTGAYLTRVGLPYSAVAYVVSVATSKAWLDPDTARRNGIEIALLPDTGRPRGFERGEPTGSLPRAPLGVVVQKAPPAVETVLLVGGLGPLAVLAVRVAPEAGAPIKSRLADGVRVAWLGSEGPWRAVRLPDGDTGWAHSRYLLPTAPDVQPGMAFAPAPGRDGSYAVATAGDVVLLRAGPSLDAPWSAQLPPGTRLSVVDQRGDWLRVEVAGGPSGWARSSDVTRSLP